MVQSFYLITLSNTSERIRYKKVNKAAFKWSKIHSKQEYCKVLLQYTITVFYLSVLFIPVMWSWISSIITPVFSVTWSFRNHSNMLICCSRNIYYQCWKPLCWRKVQKKSIYLNILALLLLFINLMSTSSMKVFLNSNVDV